MFEHEPDCSFAERGINLLWHDAILSTQKEAASKPGRFSGVAVGVRIDLFDQGEQYLGSILREDLRAAGVPRVGDNLGRGTLGVEVHQLAGIALEVDHVDHYLAIPGVRDREPLSVAVVVANGVDTEAFTRLAPTLKEQGWSVMSDSYPDS